MRCVLGIPAVAVVAAVSCRADIGADPSAYVAPLVAVFDPGNGVVPMPNDVLISPGGQIRIPIELTKADGTVVKAFTPAMEELVTSYLNKLDAFPPELPLTVAFARAGEGAQDVDPATLPGALRVFDVTALAAAVAAGADPATVAVTEVTDLANGPVAAVTTPTGLVTSQVNYAPKAPWLPGHRYAAFLTTTARDLGGKPIVPPLVMNYLKARESLVSDPDPDVPGDEYAVVLVPAANQDAADKAARELEGIRVSLKPFLDYFEAGAPDAMKVPREQTLLAWTFRVTSYPSAVFDKNTGVIPLPNDALMNPATGRLGFPLPAGVKCDDPATVAALPDETRIQGEFFCWMNTKDGFQAATNLTVPVTEAPDAETLNADNVKLFDLAGGVATEVPGPKATLGAGQRSVVIDPAAVLVPGHRYLAVLSNQVGRNVGTADKPVFQPLVPPAAMAMLRLREPVLKDGKSTLPGTLSDADAAQLEPMRAATSAALDAYEAAGFDRASANVFFTFAISGGNEALYDPSAGVIPFPNDVLIDRDTGRVNLPASPADPAVLVALKAAIGTLDGFSTVAPASTSFVAPLDPASLTLANNILSISTVGIGMADITKVDPQKPETLQNLAIYGSDRVEATFDEPSGQLMLTPKAGKPLPPKSRFMVVVFDKVKSAARDGKVAAMEPSPVFALIRSKNPLAAGGKSALPQLLSDGDAAQLETLRQAYKPIFDTFESPLGIKREQVLLFFTFTTASTTDELSALTAIVPAPQAWGPAMKLEDTGAAAVKELFTQIEVYTTADGKEVREDFPYDKVGQVCLDCALKGNVLLGAPDLTDPANPVVGHFQVDAEGKPKFDADRKIPFVLVLPAGTPPAGGWPVVIYQHGLWGNRKEVATIANDLAGAGYAIVAMDAPLHGDHPVRIPGTGDGTGFFTADVFAVRDNLREMALEHRQMLQFVGSSLDAWLRTQGKAAGTVKSDGVRYLGVSLGGIAGAVSAGVNPGFERVALAVAGGHMTRIFLETQNSSFRDPLLKALTAMNIVPGTPEFNLFLVIAQWALDRADPVNFAPLAGAGGKVSERVLLVQARGDEFIPNTTTAELHDALGFAAAAAEPPDVAPELLVFPDDGSQDKACHGFFNHGCDPAVFPKAAAARTAARQAVLDFLADQEGDR
ncbi:MAG: hypothetical protein FJ087_09980 [Deltaproteobacteria bacterium]|nr:hypothetical protein [Deltaproteobacteria bacterium]